MLVQPFFQVLGGLSAKLWGVHLRSRVRFLNLPRFRNLGSIEIGAHTRIISDSRNLVGSYIKTSMQTGVHGKIIIGEHCGLSNCHIIAQALVRIGDYVYIGGGTRIYDNDFHSTDPATRLSKPEIIPSKPVIIHDKVFIGGHCLILKGLEIGENAVLGAGSVLTKSIPANEIWGGVPAKKISSLKRD